MKSYVSSTKSVSVGDYKIPLLRFDSTKYLREPGFNPLSLEKLKLWFSADTSVMEEGGNVSTWADKVSSAPAIQSNASLRPQLRVNGVGNFKYVAFDRDWLQIDSGHINFARTVHMAVIASPNAAWDNYGTIFNSNNVRASMMFFENGQTYLHNNQFPQYCYRNGEQLSSPFNLAPITNWFLIEGKPSSVRSSSEICYIAKGDLTYMCDIYMAELFVFNDDLTEEERILMQNYIDKKYGIISNNIPLS